MNNLIATMDEMVEHILEKAKTSDSMDDVLDAFKVCMAWAERREKLAPTDKKPEKSKVSVLRERLNRPNGGTAKRGAGADSTEEAAGDGDN
jgi:hypothetical protein